MLHRIVFGPLCFLAIKKPIYFPSFNFTIRRISVTDKRYSVLDNSCQREFLNKLILIKIQINHSSLEFFLLWLGNAYNKTLFYEQFWILFNIHVRRDLGLQFFSIPRKRHVITKDIRLNANFICHSVLRKDKSFFKSDSRKLCWYIIKKFIFFLLSFCVGQSLHLNYASLTQRVVCHVPSLISFVDR